MASDKSTAAKLGWQRRREREAERQRYMRGCAAAKARAERMRDEGVSGAQAVGEQVFIADPSVTPGYCYGWHVNGEAWRLPS